MNDYYNERVQNNRYARIAAKKRNTLIKRRVLMLLLFIIISLFMVISIKHFIYAQDRNNCSNKKYHSVMIYCGDTVDSITENYAQYGYKSQNYFKNEICSINNISSDTQLIAGNYLVLPYFEGI